MNGRYNAFSCSSFRRQRNRWWLANRIRLFRAKKNPKIVFVRVVCRLDWSAYDVSSRRFREHLLAIYRSPNPIECTLQMVTHEMINEHGNVGTLVSPSPVFGPLSTQVADESSTPCMKITGWPPAVAIRCNSRIYPSSVVTWCVSWRYPYLAISWVCDAIYNVTHHWMKIKWHNKNEMNKRKKLFPWLTVDNDTSSVKSASADSNHVTLIAPKRRKHRNNIAFNDRIASNILTEQLNRTERKEIFQFARCWIIMSKILFVYEYYCNLCMHRPVLMIK